MKLLLLAIIFAAPFYSDAQTVIRANINCIGSSNNGGSIQVQQTVGQPYNTKSYNSNEIESRPGFIQPSQIWVELVRNTFTIEINVYPNPTESSVDFKLNQNLEDLNLKVMDQQGKLIFEDDVESLRNYTLNCSDWNAGQYIIFITDKSGNIYQSKLSKT